MNKRVEVILVTVIFLAVLTVIGIIVGSILKKNDTNLIQEIEAMIPDPEEKLIVDDSKLYDKVKEYIEKERTEKGYDNKQQDYKVFVHCERVGITDQGFKKNVYAWILEKSYYVRGDKPQISEGSSTLYKFIIKNNEVVGYENPKLGNDYNASLLELVPTFLQNKVLSLKVDETAIDKEIKEYYKYLDKDNSELYNIDEQTKEENE